MKKIFTSILAVIYLTFNAGATLHLHYCMGEFDGYSLFRSPDKKCGKCGMEKHSQSSKGCCKDISVCLKATDSHNSSLVYSNASLSPVLAPVFFCVVQGIILDDQTIDTISWAHGPGLLKKPLYLQHRNFRI